MSRAFIFGALGCVAFGLSGAAYAESSSPSQSAIAGQLMPKMMQATRGIPIAGAAQRAEPSTSVVTASTGGSESTAHKRAPAPARQPARAEPAPAAAAAPSASLDTIQFEFNSAQLKPESIPTLRALGNALNQELKDQKIFVIEGHTDGVGSIGYNSDLSKRRAETVKDYLVNEMGVAAQRLETVGKGSADLANSKDPSAKENRRVVVVNNTGA